ncbi:MAG: hypothetical protein LAO31_11665 [Acidobacteriia bacterium]|nr:hypothetical protein [Terriglobia bacterium]
MRNTLEHLRNWLQETHSTGFELSRFFLLHSFDGDFVSAPGQWRPVTFGVIAILLSSCLVFAQVFSGKYMILNWRPSVEPFRRAVLADTLFLITLAMFVIGLFTSFQWASLFPGLRDYLALASLPIRLRELFMAKFAALLAFTGVFIGATTLPLSVMLPTAMSGRYATTNYGVEVAAILVSSSLGALFVFFSLVVVQGVLLNIIPIRQFTRVSLVVQGLLLTVLMCALPFVFSIPGMDRLMDNRPDWAVWIPPLWFLGLHQVMVGAVEPYANRLAALSLAAVGISAVAVLLTYTWSYRRHRIRLMESAVIGSGKTRPGWLTTFAAWIIPDSRKLAVFSFIAKTLSRNQQHRLVLTAFAGLAVAMIFESFISLALSRGFRGFSAPSPALRLAAISAPLALSLFMLAGFRYLFRLPVELRANWPFRVNEEAFRRAFLGGVKWFLICGAVLPVAALTLPLEMYILGWRAGLSVTLLCLLPSLALMELLLMQIKRIPFTSSYLPGQRPVIETVMLYGVALFLYVSVLASLMTWCLEKHSLTLGLTAILIAIWMIARKVRRKFGEEGRIEFDELPEPVVMALDIDRD